MICGVARGAASPRTTNEQGVPLTISDPRTIERVAATVRHARRLCRLVAVESVSQKGAIESAA